MRCGLGWGLGVVLLVIGCTDTAGQAGDAGEGSCEALEPAAPRAVELLLTNARADPIFLAAGCGAVLGLERVGEQSLFAADTCDLPTCASALDGECVTACAACIPGVLRIEPGASYSQAWAGTLFEAQEIAQTCSACTEQCWQELTAPDGDYRLHASVFLECPESLDDCSCPAGASEPCFIEAYDGAVNADAFQLDFRWPAEDPIELRVE